MFLIYKMKLKRPIKNKLHVFYFNLYLSLFSEIFGGVLDII